MAINQFLQPSPRLMFGEAGVIEPMITNSLTVPSVADEPDKDLVVFSVPAVLVNVGDMLKMNFSGTGGTNVTIDIFADSFFEDGDGVFWSAARNLGISGGNQRWRAELLLTLIGTNRVKTVLRWMEEDDGGSQVAVGYSNSQFKDLREGFNLVFRANDDDSSFTLQTASVEYIKNADGNPNFGTPSNLSFNEGADELTFEWNSDYPEPTQWSLLGSTGGELGYWIPGNQRTFSGISQYQDLGNISVVGVSNDLTEMTNRSQPVDASIGPVLTRDTDTGISWTWSGIDPFLWLTQVSADGETGWEDGEAVDGTERTYDDVFNSGKYVRIVGVDELNNPVTDYSNVVSPP